MSKGRGNSPTAITPLGGSGGYGGSHSSAPSLNFPTSSGLFNITTTPLTMVHTIANSSELLGIPLPDDEPRTKTQRSTKVYIGKIPSGISDYFMEQLFLRCGPINTWTRCLDSSGKAMSYGFIEFQTVEGMLRCLRLLNGMQLLGNRLVVRVDFQTEFFIKEWSDLKRAEWERKKMDNIMSLDRTVLTFEEFLTSEDKNTEYAIQLLIHNLEQTHEEDPIQKEEFKQDYPLLVNMMLEWANVATNVHELTKLWKGNQADIDVMKENHKELYTKLFEHFAMLRKNFEEKNG